MSLKGSLVPRQLLLAFFLAPMLGLIFTAQSFGAPTVVRVGYLPATHDALLFVAKELKLFDVTKVDVQLKPYENSVQILNDLKSGLLDIGIPGVATPAAEIGGKAPLSIIGGAAAESAALVVQPELAQPMANAQSVNGKVLLLKGKKVGAVRGSTGLAIFRQALVHAGLAEKSLDVRSFSKPSEIISALVTHDLDAGLLWSPHMTLAEGKGLRIGLWMTEVLPHHVCCRQVARDDYLANESAVVEYLAGLLRADRLLRKARNNRGERDRVFQAIRNYMPTLNEKEISLELFDAHPRTTVSADISRQGIHDYLEAMQTAGLMRKDQCQNVEEKVKPIYLQKAFERLGCSANVAKSCVDKGAAACECTR
ncbi:MAG: ABC transporter substrate-binding protein [Acidobacteriota bacterium]